MDTTGLTCFLIASLIYHVMSACNSSIADNITAQVKILSEIGSCSTNLNVTCETNLPLNLTKGFEWQKNQNNIDSNQQNILVQKIENKMTLNCTVLNSCRNVTSSSYQISCSDGNITTVLLICGAGAIIVILLFGITMKVKLKQGEAQRQARRQQRQVRQSNDSTATATSYW